LGHDTVQAMVLPTDELSAFCLAFQQELGHRRSAIEEGWFIRELLEHYRLSQAEAALKLGRSKSWISRRMALIEALPERVQDCVRAGKICAHGAMRFLVPLARANVSACLQLVEHIENAKLTSRELARLYRGLCAANPEERERILAQPLLYLKAEAALTSSYPEEQPSPDNLLLEGLELLSHTARRIIRSAPKAQIPPVSFAVAAAWQQALAAFLELNTFMEEHDVGRRYSTSDFYAQTARLGEKAHRPRPQDFAHECEADSAQRQRDGA
jgi:hypothetical protein